MSIAYHIYGNTGNADPINYSAILATPSGTDWTTDSLTFPGTWTFNVRAFDTSSNLEEGNLDCSITIVLDSSGKDITNRPGPPSALRAFAQTEGSIRVEWYYAPSAELFAPTGFHVYVGTGGSPDYGSPTATVSFTSGLANTFASTVSGLTNGTTYTFGVRAFNAIAEESNTNVISVVADTTGPSAVLSLTALATPTS
jgi:hypothetical protein